MSGVDVRDSPHGAAGRRCYLTVLFSDVSGSSQHAEELEAEDYAALLGDFRRAVREIVPRHGGSIARLQGDGVLALFGIEGSNEEDGRRATEAALELHAAVGRSRARSMDGVALQLHTGIHAGLVLLLKGDIERGRFDVVGEVPNTASRLCSMATAGEILVSQESLGPRQHFFELEWSRRVAVRGRHFALDVVKVLGATALRRRIDAAARRGVVPFVGREQVLGVLLDEAARLGPHAAASTVLHLSGEPGVGKTRLLDEFCKRLDAGGFLVVQGYCEGHLGAQPLQPFLTGLAQALKSNPVQDLELEGADGLSDALKGDGAPALPLSLAARPGVVVGLLRLLSAERALVLILDDWQWADDASRQMLHQVLAGMPRLLVVLAARRGALADDPAAERARLVELPPLDDTAVSAVVRAWIPGADEFMVQQIQRASGGSPLFLEELCQAVLAGGDLAPAPAERGAAWINALVASRMAQLPPALSECLQAASVVGNVLPMALMMRLLGDAAAAAMPRLVDQDFLLPLDATSYRFRHGLTRDAVYATVDSARRVRWHLRVAQILEAETDGLDRSESLEALAHHFHAAQRGEQAVGYCVAAGDKAMAAMALDRARMHFLTALQALDALPVLSQPMVLQWCSIAQRLGQTCVFDPLDMSESAAKFERALVLARQSQDANTLARAEYWMAYVSYGKGRPRAAIRFCREALVHAQQSGDLRLQTQLQATLGQSLVSAGRYDEGLPLLAAAVESKRQHSRPGSGTAIGSAYSLARMGYALGDLGRFDDAHERLRQALQLLGDSQHLLRASILELECAVHLWQGRWAEAREAGYLGAQVAWRCRSRYLAAMGRALGGCAAWAVERSLPAYEALRDATYLIDARGGAVSTSLNFGWLVEAAQHHGLQADLRRHAAKLLQRAREQDRHGHAMGWRALAAFAAAQGDAQRAVRALRHAEHSAAQRGSPREQALNEFAWARLAAQCGARGEARSRLEPACRAFETMRMDWHLQAARAFEAAL